MVAELDLLDWKRRVLGLYAAVRDAPEPERAWRAGFSGLDYYPYDPALRLRAEIEAVAGETREIAGSAGSVTRFRRFARARLELGTLELYWLEGYGGGVFLPFADGTSGRGTYGGGRYLLDTVKGSDLGLDAGRLVLDFNFAYNPSCCYDDRWACPLSPPANRIAVEVPAGERNFANS